jgi:putative endonuclease
VRTSLTRRPGEGRKRFKTAAGWSSSVWVSSYAGRMKQPCVYLLASHYCGTLYVGVTSDLSQRIRQHKNDCVEGFTKRYGVHDLVWYELHDTMHEAIAREKAIKEWKRAWKIRLIEEGNREWKDLYPSIV